MQETAAKAEILEDDRQQDRPEQGSVSSGNTAISKPAFQDIQIQDIFSLPKTGSTPPEAGTVSAFIKNFQIDS